MLNFVWRTPFALFGAFGLLSLSAGGGVMQVDSNVEAWIEIWRSVVYPFWRFVLWPIEAYFEYRPPEWVLNYITIGLIFGGMSYRKDRAFHDLLDDAIDGNGTLPELLKPAKLPILKKILLWPVELIGDIGETIKILNESKNTASTINPVVKKVILNSNKVFWETGLWFFLLIAINYAFLFKDGEFRWQQAALLSGVS